jgi:uncharacterized protein
MLRLLFYLSCLVPLELPRVIGEERLFDTSESIDVVSQVAIRSLIADVEERTGAEIVVVTKASLSELDIEEEATDVFADFGFGRKSLLNAILFLVDTDSKRVAIVTGYGMEQLLPRYYLQAMIDEFVAYPLASGEIGEAVFMGVEQLAGVLKRYPLAAQGSGEGIPIALSTPRLRALLFAGFVPPFFILGMILAWWVFRRRIYAAAILYSLGITILFFGSTFLGYFLEVNPGGLPWFAAGQTVVLLSALGCTHWMLYRRFGPHTCQTCRSRLQLLRDANDADLIWETSFLEYTVHGRSEDVWFCSNCLRRKTERYVQSYLDLADCPNCKAPALRQGRKVIKAPSIHSHGLDRLEGACISCKYSYVSDEVVPKIATVRTPVVSGIQSRAENTSK